MSCGHFGGVGTRICFKSGTVFLYPTTYHCSDSAFVKKQPLNLLFKNKHKKWNWTHCVFKKAYQAFAHRIFILIFFLHMEILAFIDNKIITFLWDPMSIFLHLSTKSKPQNGYMPLLYDTKLRFQIIQQILSVSTSVAS